MHYQALSVAKSLQFCCKIQSQKLETLDFTGLLDDSSNTAWTYSTSTFTVRFCLFRNLIVTVFAVFWLILWVFYLLFSLFPGESIKNVSHLWYTSVIHFTKNPNCIFGIFRFVHHGITIACSMGSVKFILPIWYFHFLKLQITIILIISLIWVLIIKVIIKNFQLFSIIK